MNAIEIFSIVLGALIGLAFGLYVNSLMTRNIDSRIRDFFRPRCLGILTEWDDYGPIHYKCELRKDHDFDHKWRNLRWNDRLHIYLGDS